MKIAYVTNYDASDIHSWSGTGSNILSALIASGFQVDQVGNLRDRATLFFQAKNWFYSRIMSQTYFRDREPRLLRYYARQAEEALAGLGCNAVFSPGTIPIAYLHMDRPIVFWTDATFAGMLGFSPLFSNLCAETIRNGNRMEQAALSNCRLAIYSSEWAANSAIRSYDVDPAKVKVVPFGANLDCDRNLQAIERIAGNKELDPCKLLFVGTEWSLKGGDVAVAVAGLLNRRGLRTELHIVGCEPPNGLPDFVVRHGFISKKNEAGRNRLDRLMSEAHFLILPSRADCFGVVFPEASSFGLPSLATNVGGIPSAVRDGKNGWTFSLDAGPEAYCDIIEQYMASRVEYTRLALSSFTEYTERLNWSSAGRKVHDLVLEFCA